MLKGILGQAHGAARSDIQDVLSTRGSVSHAEWMSLPSFSQRKLEAALDGNPGEQHATLTRPI